MKLMEWDSNLAHQAQNWTDTCPDKTSSIQVGIQGFRKGYNLIDG